MRSGFKEFADATAASLLVAIFVIRHFFRRLSSETVALRRTFRMLHAYVLWNRATAIIKLRAAPFAGVMENSNTKIR